MSDTKSARDSRAGLHWQDIYAAWVLVRFWLQPEEGIHAIWPEADGIPHVEDLLVRYSDRVVYHQLKHSVDPEGRFTGADLFGIDRRTNRSLFNDLYRGYKKAHSTDPGHRIIIHLLTTQSLSDSARNKPISVKRFQEEILLPLGRASNEAFHIPSDLTEFWQDLQNDLGIAEEELVAFLRTLRLQSDCPTRSELKNRIGELLQRHAMRPPASLDRDVHAIIGKVQELATSRLHNHWIMFDDVVSIFDRLFPLRPEIRRHYLALPVVHVERREIADQILTKLRSVSKGYVFVVGAPGSGKTTLATWLANQFPEIITARYHAFDPSKSSNAERQQRVKSESFVRDLLEALHLQYPTEFPLPRFEPGDFQPAIDAFWTGLGKVGTRRRVVLLIDGLDHAIRAKREIDETLVQVLRPESQVPCNVVFLLFGQPNWDYPHMVRNSVRIELAPFSKEEARKLMQHLLPVMLTEPEEEIIAAKIFDGTRGNPLSVHY